MKKIDFLIIGGGAAGTTAAETLRQNNKDASIIIVSDEPYRFYSRILISKPYFFLEKIPFEQVWLKTEAWYSENKIELLMGRSAIHLDQKNKIVKLDDGTEIVYGKLLLAVGGHARRWNVSGADKKGVGYLRNLEEAKEMMKNVKTAKRAIAIGSGFVSFEIAEILRKAGLETSIVMMEPYYWYPVFDEELGKFIERAMEKEGVKLIRKAEVAEVLGKDKVKGVLLKDGSKLDCEVIACGIGLDYNLGWVKESGIETNRGILANEYLQTNNPDIFTAGDCSEFNDIILKERIQLANWVNAQSQGTAAALNMLGKNEPFKLVSFYTAQAFGINISMVGDIKVGEGKTVISRGTPEANSIARIMIKDNKIVGATLLNRTPELFQISKLIEQRVDVSGQENNLADANFNLATLIS
ncbi:MAG: FAD-dependent oxidoreductase [Patescibacteria group bacterium]|jgi:NAD(P)H-nitrite reductase large subunit